MAMLMFGCGGHLARHPTTDGGARRGGGGAGGSRDGGNPPVGDAPVGDEFPVFHEDACPNVPPAPPPPLECDPFVQNSCPPGEGCYPIPPRATDACHPGSYSTLCLPAGRG